MILFHGTMDKYRSSILKGVDLSKSKPYLDFGSGFYTTPNKKFAINTARFRCDKNNSFPNNSEGIPCIIVFDLDFDSMKKCSIKSFGMANDEWARFIVANRLRDNQRRLGADHNFDSKYDMVHGPAADGRYLDDVVHNVDKGIIQLKYCEYVILPIED